MIQDAEKWPGIAQVISCRLDFPPIKVIKPENKITIKDCNDG